MEPSTFIPKNIKKLLREPHSIQLIGLYTYYFHLANEQKNDTFYLNNKETQGIFLISLERLKTLHNILIQLQYIEIIRIKTTTNSYINQVRVRGKINTSSYENEHEFVEKIKSYLYLLNIKKNIYPYEFPKEVLRTGKNSQEEGTSNEILSQETLPEPIHVIETSQETLPQPELEPKILPIPETLPIPEPKPIHVPKKTSPPRTEVLKEKNKKYLPLAQLLAMIVKKQTKRKAPKKEQYEKWCNDIRLLCEQNSLSIEDVRTALLWQKEQIEKNINPQFTLEIQSGIALREKWNKLQTKVVKESTPKKPDIVEDGVIYHWNEKNQTYYDDNARPLYDVK